MSEAKHTAAPGPWEIDPFSDGETTAIYAPLTDEHVCIIQHGNLDIAGNGIGPNETELANAEFIVRACNSHEALLAACQAALANLEDRAAEFGETGDALRAAIAKATQEVGR